MSNNYAGLKARLRGEKGAAERCAERLLAIRKRLEPIRKRKSESTLLLATWNIRDFDSGKFGWGKRRPETLYYIAEMIACFDLVAVQEVARDLGPLEEVMRILGREWDYIATDTTEGTGGNGERMAFLYNTEKVWFRKVAGEIVLPDGQLIVSKKKVAARDNQPDVAPTTVEMKQQFARSPFLVAFQSGWFRFSLCTVHIYFGDDSGEKLKRRIAEIEALVKFFADRQDSETRAERDSRGAVENYILLGDFNVVSPEHKTMAALKGQGFAVPPQIDGRQVRKLGDHFYDQIAVRVKDPRFEVLRGGLIDLFEDVFRDTPEDRAIYDAHVPQGDGPSDGDGDRYLTWRTWQMSDHAPLWVEIRTDFADAYLAGIAGLPPG